MLVNGHMFYKKNDSRRRSRLGCVKWVCAKSDIGCRAKLTTIMDIIIAAYDVHNHVP